MAFFNFIAAITRLQFKRQIVTPCKWFLRMTSILVKNSWLVDRVILWIILRTIFAKEKQNAIVYACIQTENNFVPRLLIPIAVKMTGTCQSVQESCNLFVGPQLTSFLVFYNLPHVSQIFTAYRSIWRYQLSGKFRIDRWIARCWH